ncbi:MAG TPA: hypothetical protein VLW55_13895 [Burkholderiaceae bacterium]|nr:hypothetical protein [Burkholderiaceae bacterium]
MSTTTAAPACSETHVQPGGRLTTGLDSTCPDVPRKPFAVHCEPMTAACLECFALRFLLSDANLNHGARASGTDKLLLMPATA